MKTLPLIKLQTSQIVVPLFVGRDKKAKVDDEILRKSITESGIQQPLVVVSDGERFVLVDGARRLEAAKTLAIPMVNVMVDTLPANEKLETYVLKIRFILDEHRQDLKPSQKAVILRQLKEVNRFTDRDLARYLGTDPDTITNWLAVLKYIPKIQHALDAGVLTMTAARVFDGMTEEGQKRVWEKHDEELCGPDGAKLHRVIRDKYPPDKFKAFYRNASLTSQRLARPKGRRNAKARANYTDPEKAKLMKSLDLKEDEIAMLDDEERLVKWENEAAAPIVAAVLRNPKLKALVPETMLPQLERFAEAY